MGVLKKHPIQTRLLCPFGFFHLEPCSGSRELWLLKMVVTATPWQLEGQNEFRVLSKLGPMHFLWHIVPWQIGPRPRSFLFRQSGPQFCFGGKLGLGKLGPQKFGGKLGPASRIIFWPHLLQLRELLCNFTIFRPFDLWNVVHEISYICKLRCNGCTGMGSPWYIYFIICCCKMLELV